MSENAADTITLEDVRKAMEALDRQPVPGPEGRVMYWPEWTAAHPDERREIERRYGFDRGVVRKPL